MLLGHGHGVILAIGLVALALTLVSCFSSPLSLERQALSHAQKALDHANRLIPLLQTSQWKEAYQRTAKVKGELEEAIFSLDSALKQWALQGHSPLSYELDALEILNEVAEGNQSIQNKLSSGEIITSIQNRLIEKAKENAKGLERVIEKLNRAIEQRLSPKEGE